MLKRQLLFSSYWRGENLLFIKNAISSLFVKVLSLVLIMLVAVVLARQMGATEYGRLAYIQSVTFILSAICTLGLRDAANRIVARYVAREQRALLARFIIFGTIVIALASCILVAAVHIALSWAPHVFAQAKFPPWTVLGVVLSLAVLSFLAPTLVALGRPLISFTSEHIGPRALILIAAVCYLLFGKALTADIVLDLSILSNTIPAILLGVLAFIQFRLPLALPERASHVIRSGRAWLSISVYMMTSPIISLVFSETAIIVLGIYAEPSQIALYQIARRVSELATVSGAVAAYLALPSIARYYTLKRYEQLQHTVDITNALTIIPSAAVALILIIGGDRLLLLFGSEFRGAYTAALILSIGRTVDQLSGPVLEILFMTGRHVIATWINISYGVLNVLLCFALIPYYGQTGAAFGTIVVGVLWKLNLYLVLRRHSSIQPCLPLAVARGVRHYLVAS
jgi:O-antigen/teichoic acid export membrane protein